MTVVRDLGGPSGSIRTLIGACDVTDDQSWVAYIRMGEGAAQWFIARNNAAFENAVKWMAFGYESNHVIFYPGTKESGESLPTNTWILVCGTNDASGGASHFYAYDLEANELLFSVTGATGPPAHAETAQRLVFGRWDTTEQFNGLYAAAAVYNTTISEAEFKALAKAASVEAWLGMGKTPSGLWVFDQKEGQETLDLTGNGANGSFAIQDNFAIDEVVVPLALREEEGEGGGGGEGVLVKAGGGLVEGKRYVKQGGVLVPG